MPKTIEFDLSPEGVAKGLRELLAYKKWVEMKTAEIQEKLAIIGAHEASVRFSGAMYDGTNDSYIDVQRKDNGVWEIRAQGEAVCFIEFGAGVYYNGSEPYPNPRPEGIVGIGEYGKGHGKYPTWGFYDDDGILHKTHGNPAAMPMYYSVELMQRELTRIAHEVFG